MLLLPVTVGGSGFYQPALRVPVQAVAVYGAPRALPSYAYVGLKIRCMNIIDILYSYFGLVLGCINADLCKYNMVSRSTLCVFFYSLYSAQRVPARAAHTPVADVLPNL